MKVSLLSIGTRIFDSYKNNDDYLNKKSFFTASMPPIGLLYLDAVLENLGYKTMILDQSSTGMPLDIISKRIKKFDPDVIGLSVLSNSSITSNKVARKLKDLNPNVKICYGNCHSTIWARRILENYEFIDFCIRGEGEKSFPQVLDAIENNRSFENIAGLTYRSNDGIKENKEPPLIEKLDDLPFPNRSKLDINYDWDFGGIKFAQDKFTSILTSRGCPFRCKFCMNSLFARHKWRTRSVGNIIDELLLLEGDKYREVFFLDDNFTLRRDRVIDLCKQIKKEKIDIVFSSRGRVDQKGGNMFKIMHDHGNFKYISFGIESGTKKILDYYDKRISPEQARDTVKLARRAGFDFIMANFMVGAPNEKIDDIMKTLRFILSLEITWPVISIVQAIPGTKLWQDIEKNRGIDIDRYWETGVPVVDLDILDYSRETLERMVLKTYNDFTSIKRLNYLLPEFYKSLTSLYKLKKMIHIIRNLTVIRGLYRKTLRGLSE
jgi:radical SAM superfamily enzyme YgiQ (UPF0313 family)